MTDTDKPKEPEEQEARLHIRVTESQRRHLKVEAAKKGMSMSELARERLFGSPELMATA